MASSMNDVSELDMMKLWKGLFYCMWMSDKLPVQQELGRTLASLMMDFGEMEMSMLYVKCFWRTMIREWNGIDRLRMDKYYFLVKAVIRQTFAFLEMNEWKSTDAYMKILSEGILSGSNDKVPASLLYCVCENYGALTREVAKPADASKMAELFFPFITLAATTILNTPKVLFGKIKDAITSATSASSTEEDVEETVQISPRPIVAKITECVATMPPSHPNYVRLNRLAEELAKPFGGVDRYLGLSMRTEATGSQKKKIPMRMVKDGVVPTKLKKRKSSAAAVDESEVPAAPAKKMRSSSKWTVKEIPIQTAPKQHEPACADVPVDEAEPPADESKKQVSFSKKRLVKLFNKRQTIPDPKTVELDKTPEKGILKPFDSPRIEMQIIEEPGFDTIIEEDSDDNEGSMELMDEELEEFLRAQAQMQQQQQSKSSKKRRARANKKKKAGKRPTASDYM